MPFLLFLFFSLTSLHAYSTADIQADYKAQNYERICKNNGLFIHKDATSEEILTIIGDACARVDSLNPLAIITKTLLLSPQSRESASYFMTLLLQKKLIYQFMHDGVDLKNLRLPQTDHVLSIVFEQLVLNNYEKREDKIIITIQTMQYHLWLSNDTPKRVYIDEYSNNVRVKQHWYL